VGGARPIARCSTPWNDEHVSLRRMSRAAPSSLPPLGAGGRLGEAFEIVGVLGEGGTGVVYDALRLPEREPVALKVIHDALLTDQQIRGRFTREASILRRLDGPHLSAVLDFGEVPDPRRPGVGLLYIAMPKVDGPALDLVLRREGPLPLERALGVMAQVLGGLQAAHAQGVIHRDLKPANVLLRGGAHAIVVDFGMAKIVTGGGAETTVLTSHNMVFGTPEYMSPEQARGDELDARCDVYAAGIILYELATGAVPFSGETPLKVLTAHLTSPPPSPREIAPARGISPALEVVILHAIAKDPADRYASAAALSAAIGHARAAPDDVASVHPASFSPTGHADVEAAHAPTMPIITTPRERDAAPDDDAPNPLPTTTRPPPSSPMNARAWAIVALIAVASIGIGVLLSFLGN
jgi:eukaryotic-like serine/threonine-protein kinase